MLTGSFEDLFGEELRFLVRALLALGAVSYAAKHTFSNTLLGRDEVQYAISAHLQQCYDRSVVTSRSEQRLTKSLMMKCLRIDVVKEQIRCSVDREGKLNGLNELFPLTLAGIVAAAHVHSLTVTLNTVKSMTLVLVHLLRRLEASQATRVGNNSVIGKLRSWWAGGTQQVVMEVLMAQLQNGGGGDGDSPFTCLLDEESVAAADADRYFSVESILRVAVPRVVETARQTTFAALHRRAPHAFSATAVTTGREIRALLCEVCAGFELCVAWSEWLTAAPALLRSNSAALDSTTRSRSGSGYEHDEERGNGNNNNNININMNNTINNNNNNNTNGGGNVNGNAAHSRIESSSSSSSSDEIFEFPSGSTAMPPSNDIRRQQQQRRDCRTFDSVFGPPRAGHDGAERNAQNEALRREELAREQAAQFFHEIIHSTSFSELCIAYAAEVLSRVMQNVCDLRTIRSYDAATDSVRIPQLTTAMETHRLSVFDREFEVQPYLRLFCEETIRATCRHT